MDWDEPQSSWTQIAIHPGSGPQELVSLAPWSLQDLPLCHKSLGEIEYHCQMISIKNQVSTLNMVLHMGRFRKNINMDKLLSEYWL